MGGVESYLEILIPALLDDGHQVAFWHEVDEPTGRERIALPREVKAWCVAEEGAENALSGLRHWQPDLIYAHRFLDLTLEEKTLGIAPAIFFAHDYNGACISGSKTFKAPVPRPCGRRFDWQCLLHYYPHRCGGLSPLTMIRDYGRQSARLEMLRRYRAIIVNSNHMRNEFARYGLTTHQIYLPVSVRSGAAEPPPPPPAPAEWRLLFLGRMEFLKGGQTFIDALPQVSRSIKRPLFVTFAGDGPERERWQERAARIAAQAKDLHVEFVGWVNDEQRERLLDGSHLLVMPSLWPEPFGLVGLESGLRGVPVAAFAVGAIPEWLKNGVNGFLAPGNPPTDSGLADAIIKCLDDHSTYEHLRHGALKEAQQYSKEKHLHKLLEIFQGVLIKPPCEI